MSPRAAISAVRSGAAPWAAAASQAARRRTMGVLRLLSECSVRLSRSLARRPGAFGRPEGPPQAEGLPHKRYYEQVHPGG